MENQINRLNHFRNELLKKVMMAEVDARLVYRIRSNNSLFSNDTSILIAGIFSEFDNAVSGDVPGLALTAMEKLLGVLEGIIDDAEVSNTETNTDDLIPTFSLTSSDKHRVLDLCAQMRKIILGSEVFDQAHRRRLLNRVSGIEYQLEQPKGLLDVVRAGVSDVGETLGKFGTDIKPLTDRMKEVSDIARRSSKQYDQIPAPEEIKQLPAPDQETEE